MRKTGLIGLAMLVLAASLGAAPAVDARGTTRTQQAEPARRHGPAEARRRAPARPQAQPRRHASTTRHPARPTRAARAGTRHHQATQSRATRSRMAQSRAARARAAQTRQARHPVQRGRASFYANRFHGQRMANGERFDRQSNSAASRTLPLGTRAQVRNLDNGRTATVVIDDRGPHSRSRVLDVSPAVANRLGMRQSGTARVEIVPQLVPSAQAASPPD
jgi:rare lipoprotein A